MKNIVFILLSCYASTVIAQDWNIIEIGQCPTAGSYDLVLADGQNDGKLRIYVSTKDGGVYEWSFENNNWNLSNTIHPGPLNNLMHIAAGDARNDGKTRIYFAEWNQSARVFEAEWDGNSWQANLVGTAPNTNTGVVVGDARNDGTNRLYLSGSYGLHEWEWNGNNWANTPINDAYHEVSGDIGDARNDGTNRMVMNTNCLKELSWNGSVFIEDDLFCPPFTWTDAVQIADGRNDGVQRIYVNTTSAPGGRWEYSWTGSDWASKLIESTNHRGDIHLAKLKSDGRNRVYTTTSEYFAGPADDLFEYEWNGTDWVQTGSVLDAVSGATAMLASGNGRNDDTIRLYTPNFVSGGIYEITHTTPYTLEPTTTHRPVIEKADITVFPNPWNKGDLLIRVNFAKATETIDFELLNALGQVIVKKSGGSNTENEEYNINCNTCREGIYYLKISDGEKLLAVHKIVRL